MKLWKTAGATSEIWQLFIQDSSSTTGAGLAGLAFNTAGLTAYYHRDTDTTATAITLATMTVGSFTSSGFKEIDATNMPGWYQFCPPNAALAAGAKSCGFHLKGATNMAPLPIECQLTAVNPDSATAFETSIGSVTGSVGSVTGAVGSVTGAVGSVTGNVGGNVVGSVGSLTVNNDKTGYAIGTGGIAAASFAAGAIDAAAIAADAIGSSEFAAAAVTKIWANACTEPAAVVAASPTAIAALSWLLTLSRNLITQTATTQTLKADDGATTIATATVSDDGVTFSRSEWA